MIGGEKTEPRIVLSLFLALSFVISSFFIEAEGNSPEKEMRPARTPSFVNISIETGLAGYTGDNLAWGDYNNDDHLDLLVRGPSSNYLFRNNGPPNWDFTEVSNETGVNTARGYSQWADYDADGYLDFYTAGDDDHLFRNNGPPHWDFTDVTSSAGNPSDGLPTEGIAWGDYNRDGYPDVYTVGWRKPGDLQWPYAGEMDRLYRNNGDGTFSDVSIAAGLNPRETSYAGMGVAWCDPNEDGWPDIYVCNYHLTPNELWINDRDGTFIDMASEYNLTGKATEYQGNTYYGHCNGAGWADFDNDQDMDVWVSHLAHKDDERSGMNRGYYCADSELFENSGPPYLNFTDIRVQAGIPITPSGTIVQDPDTGDYMWKDEDYFGIAWGDYENDGDLDLWVPQVKTYSFWDHSFLWENDGDSTFTDKTDSSDLKVWSNTGGTFVDYDNDGDLDFCTEGTYPYKGPRELHLFRNPGNSNHWLELDLVGSGDDQTSTDATGSKVVLKSGDLTLTRYVGGDCGGHGFQQPQRLHFGLGSRSTIDEIRIYWTSGRIQKISGLKVDELREIREPATDKVEITGPDLCEMDEDDTFDIVTSATGANVVGMNWDLDNDRVFETAEDDGRISVVYDTRGWRWLRYRVKDEYGYYWDLEPVTIKVNNVIPGIVYSDLIRLNESESFFIEPEILDSPSDLEHGNMSYYMDPGTGVWQHSLDPSFEVSYDEMGEYLVKYMVTDDDGASDTHEINVDVVNRIPEVELGGPGIIDEGDTAVLTAAVTDSPPDMDRMEYRFHSGDGRTTTWQRSDRISFKYTENGTFRASVEVRDRHGDSALDSLDIIVVNEIPTVTMESVPDSVEDEEVSFEVDVKDSLNDMEELTVRWDFGDGSSPTHWSKSLLARHSYEEKGEYTVNATVRDGDGAFSFTAENILIRNEDPTCRIIAPVITEISEDTSLHFVGDVSDTPSDVDDLTYDWIIVRDDDETRYEDVLEFDHVFTTSGTYRIVLEAEDDDLDTGSASMEITVVNVPPKAELHSSMSSSYKDETVRFDASGSADTMSDMGSLRYNWDLGDGTEFEGDPEIEHTYTSSGTMKVVVTVWDDDSERDTADLVIIVRNEPPVVFIDAPDEIGAGEWFWVDASATTDTVSDIGNLVYTYDMGDGSDAVVSRENKLNYTYDTGDSYTITLTVSDGEDTSTVEHTINVVEPVVQQEEDNNILLVIALVALGILMVLILLLAVFVFIRNRQQPPPPPIAPQHMKSLNKLSGGDLPVNKSQGK